MTGLADAWQAAQERAAQAAQEEARAAERAKRALLERFHLQVSSGQVWGHHPQMLHLAAAAAGVAYSTPYIIRGNAPDMHQHV